MGARRSWRDDCKPLANLHGFVGPIDEWPGRVADAAHGAEIPLVVTSSEFAATQAADGPRPIVDPAILGSLAFAEAPDAILVADDTGRYVAANRAAEELFGVAPGTLVGRRIAEFATAERSVDAEFREFVSAGVRSGEFTLLRSDGTTRHLEFNARASVAPGLHVTVLRDLAERDRLLDGLRTSEEQWLRVFLANPVPVAVRMFESGRVIAANERFLTVAGYSRHEMIGQHAAALFTDPGFHSRLQGRLIGARSVIDEPVVLRRPDSSTVKCAASFALIEVRSEKRVVMTLASPIQVMG